MLESVIPSYPEVWALVEGYILGRRGLWDMAKERTRLKFLKFLWTLPCQDNLTFSEGKLSQ